ncbi:hypothetical protein T439DRAFT_322606 [Meredithblackwellia eburnea MCA 4105]
MSGGRARSSSSLSNSSSLASSSHRRPPLGGPTATGSSSITGSGSRPSYHGSPLSQSSLLATPDSADTPTSRRAYLSFSAAASQAGSHVAPPPSTTTTANNSQRFKKGHTRKRLQPTNLKSQNPDDLDLATLEDPEDAFRLFGVRDVRRIEKRAAEAASAKVAELRTMVGERYRDLLSAADSIVRMRHASDKLVDRLDRVEDLVANLRSVGGGRPNDQLGDLSSPTKRLSSSPPPPQVEPQPVIPTFSSPPTLSLTINLLLTIPSLVHTLLETSSFLPAARLEGVGRVIHHELTNFSLPSSPLPPSSEDDEDDYDDDEDDNGRFRSSSLYPKGKGGLLVAFPIISSQWEIISTLGTSIVRRATSDLSNWDLPLPTTAETLASILMLENVSIPEALGLLLNQRSKSLEAILQRTPASSTGAKGKKFEIAQVLESIKDVLGVVLGTVRDAEKIFGASRDGKIQPGEEGILLGLLKEIENPSSKSTPATSTSDPNKVTTPALSPILTTIPNYPLLQRLLPPSILTFTPFLSISSPRNSLPPQDAYSQIQSWLQKETERVVSGVKVWVADLKGGAKTLAQVRQTVRETLSSTSASSSTTHHEHLQSKIEETIEQRLSEVYKHHLSTVVDRVEPCLSSLLSQLQFGTSKADLDPANFLFETPLAFPQASHYSLNLPSTNGRSGGATGHGHHADPFDLFLEKVVKRVEGRSPLIDKGIAELEAHARDLKLDLAGWLGEEGEKEEVVRNRLRQPYIHSAKDTLDRVHAALAAVLQSKADDVTASLFLGNFFFMLSRSKSFARDLLLGSARVAKSQEQEIVNDWTEKLAVLQAGSLESWRTVAVRDAIHEIEESAKVLSTLQGSLILDFSSPTEEPGGSFMPSQPSAGVLAALRVLTNAVRRVGPHRIHADPSIVRKLLAEFETRCLPVSKGFVAIAQGLDDQKARRRVAAQAAWDMAFLDRLWAKEIDPWKSVQINLWRLAGGDDSARSNLDISTLQYLQRTQTVLEPLLSGVLPISASLTPETMATGPASLRMLPWGAPPAGHEFKSNVGLVRPGQRLGLLPLPTR